MSTRSFVQPVNRTEEISMLTLFRRKGNAQRAPHNAQRTTRNAQRVLSGLLLVAAGTTAGAQRAPLQGFDAYITKAMQDWKVPALAIAVVKDDSIVLMKGYGTRTMGTTQPVDEHTLFAIGSASKAFTATVVAMLVDEGKMRWDDPVAVYLPGFQLYDPYVSRELTVRDALTHRSGLSRGDLMWYATDYDRDEILRRVRFLRPSWSARARFGYQNIMYLAAGQAAARASGRSWDDLVRDRIFQPLGMTESSTSTRALAGLQNVATPHTEVDDTLRVVPWHNIDNIGPAGSINSSAADMLKWVRFQLAQGKVGGKPLVSTSALGETHMAQMVIPVTADNRQVNPYTHLSAYGMGWFLQDYRGRGLDQHGGNIDGMSAMVGLMPEEKIGLVVLTNANGSPLPSIAMYRVLDALLAQPPRDWSAEYRKSFDKQRAQSRETEQKRLALRATGTKPSLPLEKYAGVYADSMYGEARVRVENGVLAMSYGTSFDGTLEHWHYDTFRANWRTRSLGRAFATFSLDADGKVKSLDVEGIGTFGRKPDAPDTTRRIVLAATEAGKLTGAFSSETPAMTIEVTYTADGSLKLAVPGQPVYTLLADSPTRFRVTGPPAMSAGFFLEYELAEGKVQRVRLIQPEPRPTLVFTPKR
jgi:CubicO group peptidase (beta-lactamase class C family)